MTHTQVDSSNQPNNQMAKVNRLNHTLYSRLQYNASAIGKRFTHKSAPKMTSLPSSAGAAFGNSVVTHHSLMRNSGTFGVNTETEETQRVGNKPREGLQNEPEVIPVVVEERRHNSLVRSFLKPDNPFSRMTDKDMLIFNPNYQAFLQKLKQKESKSSELSRIMSQPASNKRAKKKETALFAFIRTTAKKNAAVENQKNLKNSTRENSQN